MYDLGKNALPENYQHELDKVLDRIHLSNGRPLSEPYGWLERGKEEGMQFGKDVGFGLSDYIAERVARAKDVGAVIVNLTAGTNYSVTNSQLGRDAERGVGTWDLSKQVIVESSRDLLMVTPVGKVSSALATRGIVSTANTGLRFVTSTKGKEVIVSGSVSAIASVTSQYFSQDGIDPRVVFIDTAAGIAGNYFPSLKHQLVINSVGSITSSAIQDKSLYDASVSLIGANAGTIGSRYANRKITDYLNNRYNPIGRPRFVYQPLTPILRDNYSITPALWGTVGSIVTDDASKRFVEQIGKLVNRRTTSIDNERKIRKR